MIDAKPISIEDLWQSTPASNRPFNPESLINFPDLARRYLEHRSLLAFFWHPPFDCGCMEK